MGKDFDARYPRFQIREHDRITIDGTAVRLVQQVADAWLLRPADGTGLCQTFTFGALNALSAAGKVRHEVEHFLPASLRTQPRRSELSIAVLSSKQRARLINRDAFVQGFNELYQAGLVQKTEASIAANMEEICTAATPYLAESIDLAEIDREAQAKAGNGRRSMGGKLAVRLTPVHPRTILKWVRAESRDGKAGLADRMALRGYRSSRLGVEEHAFLVTRVNTRWLDTNRPTQAIVIGDVQSDFRVKNVARTAAGLQPLGIPGRQAIRRCIRSIDPFLADLARLGREEAVKRHRPVGRAIAFGR